MQDDAVKQTPKEQKTATQDASAKSSEVSNEIKPNEVIPAGSKAQSTCPGVETETVSTVIGIVASETTESAHAQEGSTLGNASATKECTDDVNTQVGNGVTETFASPKAVAVACEPNKTDDSGESISAAPSAAKGGNAGDKA